MMKLFFLIISGPFLSLRRIQAYVSFQVVIEDAVKVNMEAHELCQRLLPQKSLSLQVHLRDGF
jgi:hypothetical protein